MNKKMNPLLWIGMVGSLMIGTSLFTNIYQALWGDHDIWWTHQSMKLPIEAAKDHFELYIGGQSLGKHLAKGTLLAVDNKGAQYTVVAQDMTVRLNNWEKVRGSLLEHATMAAFAFGVAITLFVTGLVQGLRMGQKSESSV